MGCRPSGYSEAIFKVNIYHRWVIDLVEESYKFKVRGMTCSGCAASIGRRLEELGAHSAVVDLESNQVRFDLPNSKTLSDILIAVEKIGYKFEPLSATENSPTSSIPIFKNPLFTKLIFAAVLSTPLALHMVIPWKALHNPWLQFALTTPIVLIGLQHFGRSAIRSLRLGMPNMDVLITIGFSSAYIYSVVGAISSLGQDYLFFETAAMIVTLVLLGNFLEHRSLKQTKSAISELHSALPQVANKISIKDGKEVVEETAMDDLQVNDILQVNSGDRVPLDSTVVSGQASVDESMLTGESLPVEKVVGDRALGGTLLSSGNLRVRVSHLGNDTVLANIIKLVQNAQTRKPNIQKLGDKVSAVFVPAVLGVSIITFIGWYLIGEIGFSESLMRAIAVLVVACPCAMGLATPTAVIVGVGRAAKLGILIKGGKYIETLASATQFAFDKTGTLTTGDFLFHELINKSKYTDAELKGLILGLEQKSSHPIAKSIVREFKGQVEPAIFKEVSEERGIGMYGQDNLNRRFILKQSSSQNISIDNVQILDLLCDDVVIAQISISDEIRPGAVETMSYFKNHGIKTSIISGDSAARVANLAAQLGLTNYFSQKLPDEKLAILSEMQDQGETVAYVGDGINDAPALSKANIGISLSSATQAAVQSAQVVILNGNLNSICNALAIARRTVLTIKQNLFWAFFYNILAIPVAAAGLLVPTVAALAMAFSDVVVIGNSLRLKKILIKTDMQ